MEGTTLGRTGLEASRLGFGAAEIGFLATDPGAASRLLNGLLDRGLRVIDTAAAYDVSEELIGNAIGHRRNEFVLVSKTGAAPDPAPASWSAARIGALIDRSLERLRTDRIDVMLLHSCRMELLESGEAYDALVSARDAGKVRFAGYSGDNEAAAYAALLPEISVIETSVSICDQANLREVLPRCVEANLGVLAKRPLANAAWKPGAEQPGHYGDYAAPYRDRLAKMRIEPREFGIETWPELMLRFALFRPGVHTALIGTTNLDHVDANLAAAAKGPLPDGVPERIEAAFAAAADADDEAWEGLT